MKVAPSRGTNQYTGRGQPLRNSVPQQEETNPKEFWQSSVSSLSNIRNGTNVFGTQQKQTTPKELFQPSTQHDQEENENIEMNSLNLRHSRDELPSEGKKVMKNAQASDREVIHIPVKVYLSDKKWSTPTIKYPAKVTCTTTRTNRLNYPIIRSTDQQHDSSFVHRADKILPFCAKKCGIDPPFLPMFGLWDSAKKLWVDNDNLVSSLNECALEFRARFTFQHEINGKFSDDKVDVRWRNLNSLPYLSHQVVNYIYNQRREMFFNKFPCDETNEEETKVLALLYPENDKNLNDKMLWQDVIPIFAILDLLSRGESEKTFAMVLPPNILKNYQDFYFWKRWIIQERFKQTLKKYKEQQTKNMPGLDSIFHQKCYVNYVESLMPMLMTEVFQLSNESEGTIAVNGDKGIVIVIQSSCLSKLLMDHQDFPKYTDSDSFGLSMLKKEEVVLLYLDFSSLADLTILHQTDENMECKIFLSDVLGHQLVLTFPDRKTANQFSSCVEGYYRLFVDSYRTPKTCTIAAYEGCNQFLSPSEVSDTTRPSEFSYENPRDDCSSFLHGPVASGHLRKKLTSSAAPFASVFRRSPTNFDDYDLLIKLTKNNGDVEILLSTIRRDEDDYLKLEGFSDEHSTKHRSIHQFIKYLPKLAGIDERVCRALKNIISPLTEAISQEKHIPKPEVTVPASDIAKVKNILNGKFSRTLICRYQKGGSDIPFAMSESVTCKDPMERQHSCQSLSNSKKMMQQLRHHEHINKVIGTTPGGEYVWEYSTYGNITDYLQDPAKVNSVDQKITGYWLLQVYYQMASAFSFMESINIAHGHLCGSTIVLFQVSPIPFIKINHPGISSFVSGMNGREVIETPTLEAPWIGSEYCKKDENIHNKYVPTVNGDKWSFATTVCEINIIASSGRLIENTEVANEIVGTEMETRYLEYSSILSPPYWLRAPGSTIPAVQNSGAIMESLLKRCWDRTPTERPLFSDIRRTLATLVHYGVGQQQAFEPEIGESDNPFHGLDLPCYRDIELIRQTDLGSGNFGEVTCNWDCETRELVAVKTMLKQYDMHERVAFEREFRIMSKITHENIVKIKGIAFPSVRIVLEYLSEGSLWDIVKNHTRKRDHPAVLPHTLHKYACDIAQGMVALHEKKIVHCDLALRNILVSREGTCYVAKISDFGLARLVRKNCNYYRNHSAGPLPLYWYAPECLSNSSTKYCFQSDVWSYGVTIWELYNFGAKPYLTPLRGKHFPDRKEKFSSLLKRGCRLEQEDCPKEVYDNVVCKCWKYNPSERITFPEIIQYLCQNY